MGCDCSTPEARKEAQWWGSDHGTLVGISGPPRSGRSAFVSLLEPNLGNAFILRQEDYSRATKRSHVPRTVDIIDHTKLRNDVITAADHYDFVIVEGRWAFHDEKLLNLMAYKVQLDLDPGTCEHRMMAPSPDGKQEISTEDYDKFFKPYFEDKAGYVHSKVDAVREGAMCFDASGAPEEVEGFAQHVLAVIFETQSPSVGRHGVSNGASSSSSGLNGARATGGASSSSDGGHGAGASSSSATVAPTNAAGMSRDGFPIGGGSAHSGADVGKMPEGEPKEFVGKNSSPTPVS